MARNTAKGKNQNGASLGFEAELFPVADGLRQNLEPSEIAIRMTIPARLRDLLFPKLINCSIRIQDAEKRVETLL